MKLNLALIAAVALAACSTTAQTAANDHAPAGKDCFLASMANGYSVVNSHTVRVTINSSRHYLLGTGWNASDLDWTQTIALTARGTHWICTGNGLGVEVVGGQPARTYPITSVAREVEAPQGS